jgi:hypothetical protein
MSAQPDSVPEMQQVCSEMDAACKCRQMEMMQACMDEMGMEDDREEEMED